MKFKTTRKAVEKGYRNIIRVGYCDLWYLLHYKNPVAYTCGKDGWNADIYEIDDRVAICTGYRTFGNIRVDYDLQKEYNDKAREIICSKKFDDNPREKVEELLKEFINKIMKEEN